MPEAGYYVLCACVGTTYMYHVHVLCAQDGDVGAERKKVMSGATSEEDVVVIKNLVKVELCVECSLGVIEKSSRICWERILLKSICSYTPISIQDVI